MWEAEHKSMIWMIIPVQKASSPQNVVMDSRTATCFTAIGFRLYGDYEMLLRHDIIWKRVIAANEDLFLAFSHM